MERIINLCDDKDWSVRDASARALGSMSSVISKPLAENVINKLLELTRDFDPSVRDSASRSLIRLKSIIPKAPIEEVNDLLKDQHEHSKTG